MGSQLFHGPSVGQFPHTEHRGVDSSYLITPTEARERAREVRGHGARQVTSAGNVWAGDNVLLHRAGPPPKCVPGSGGPAGPAGVWRRSRWASAREEWVTGDTG